MLVDWVTVLAQAVNFIILVLLLRWLLFGPITKMMEERRQGIEQLVADTRRAEAEANDRSEKLEALRADLEVRKKTELERARSEADRWAAETREQARREVEELKTRWTDTLLRERESFWREFETLLAGEVYAVSAAAVSDLAGTDLDVQIQRSFLSGLASLNPEERAKLAQLADAGEEGAVLVLSAMELSSAYRNQVISAVRELLGPEAQVTFEVQPGLLAGVEMRGAGFKMGWSVRGHLDRLRGTIDSFLAARMGADADDGGTDVIQGAQQPEARTGQA
jgi:F-type H+-transporting ATPase subunit b